jgi:hypothetical protein
MAGSREAALSLARSGRVAYRVIDPSRAAPSGRARGAKRAPRVGADFSFASSDFKALGAFFCNFPNRDLVIL